MGLFVMEEVESTSCDLCFEHSRNVAVKRTLHRVSLLKNRISRYYRQLYNVYNMKLQSLFTRDLQQFITTITSQNLSRKYIHTFFYHSCSFTIINMSDMYQMRHTDFNMSDISNYLFTLKMLLVVLVNIQTSIWRLECSRFCFCFSLLFFLYGISLSLSLSTETRSSEDKIFHSDFFCLFRPHAHHIRLEQFIVVFSLLCSLCGLLRQFNLSRIFLQVTDLKSLLWRRCGVSEVTA